MMLDQSEKRQIQKEMERFESKRSAILPALHLVQDKRGWLPDELLLELANFMEMPAAWFFEVRSFYTMYNDKPIGKNHVQVCTNITCSMKGGREIAQEICEKYQSTFNEKSSCGKVTVSRVECLGACDKAPVMQVNKDYYENLNSKKALKILKDLESK